MDPKIYIILRRSIDHKEHTFFLKKNLEYEIEDLKLFGLNSKLHLAGISINGVLATQPVAASQPILDLSVTFYEWLQNFVIDQQKMEASTRVYYSITGEICLDNKPDHFYSRQPGPFNSIFSALAARGPTSEINLRKDLKEIILQTISVSPEDKLRLSAALVALFQVSSASEPSFIGAFYLLMVALFIREIQPKELVDLLEAMTKSRKG